ncbi:MAG TPA: fumarylacetoacetase, partial [Phenylobacterium sp.]
LFAALAEGASAAERTAVDKHLRPMAGTQLLLPCRPSNFGDFYSSIHHAINIGSLVRPDNPLLPNYKWLPVGYHGRTSSIVPSGQDFHRPWGQLPGADRKPEMGPCRRLDWEAELGFLVGRPNRLGEPIPIDEAHEHLFGVALLNDWSARDIQFWEYVPLGPFLGKSFATTLGSWVVTREALAPFRCAPPWDAQRAEQLLPHLDGEQERRSGGFAITVEVHLRSERMRRENLPRQLVSRSNYRDAYWTIGQLVTHQASNGANLEPGDLIGSGTLSGPQPESRACLMEMTRGGAEPFVLSSGEQRTFIEDGDEVTLVGYCELPGHARIGLGECTARVLPANAGWNRA